MDSKDRMLLLELDTDATQSLKNLGKKLRMTKEAVLYRIRHLEEKGIISNYITLSHFSTIGLTHYKLYIKFSHMTERKKKELIRYVIREKNLGWLVSAEGSFDLMISIR